MDSFLQSSDVGYPANLERLRQIEFQRLKGSVYLDHVGTTLYAASQLENVFKDFSEHVYGNPHSRNESGLLTAELIDHVRQRVAEFFNTSLDTYNVVFTSGATGAIKLLAETFDWSENSCYSYLEDNHTSILGVRSVAKQSGTTIACLTSEKVTQLLGKYDDETFDNWNRQNPNDEAQLSNCLFAYPTQSNFCGRKYPLWWSSAVQNGLADQEKRKKWFVLLDAAASVGTSPLDLGRHQPDFVCFSFHKIFGYPTGLGCLLVRKSAEACLAIHSRYFGGGTVLIASATQQFEIPRNNVEERLEAGTVSFLDILAVKHGFNTLQLLTETKSLRDAVSVIRDHTFHLAQYVYRQMKTYRHSNGQPAVILHCHDDFEMPTTQGVVVNFNLLQPDGQFIGFVKVENVANVYGIHLRTGCMCNPGACQRYLALTFQELKKHFEAGHVCGDDRDLIDGQPTGSVRISFGYMSTMDDVRQFLRMVETCFVDSGKDQSIHYSIRRTTSGEVIKRGDSEGASRRKPLWKSPDVEAEIDEREKGHLARLKDGDGHRDEALPTSIDCRPDEVISSPIVRQDLAVKQENKLGDLLCNCFPRHECCGSHIKAITLYPIKSCGGFEVDSWRVGRRGFLFDRNWAIVVNRVPLTQKREPKLCLIQPQINLNRQILEIHCKGLMPIEVPLDLMLSPTFQTNVNLCQTKICSDRVETIDCGDEVANWLSRALKREGDCRLLQQCNYSDRKSRAKEKIAINSSGPTESYSIRAPLSLVNEAQFLLLNHESAKFLACHVPMDSCEGWNEDVLISKLLSRFRGNLIVEGMPAFDEENWTGVEICCNRYKVEGLCNRCQMICVDQESGEKSKEPFSTLATIRKNKVQFGIYLHMVNNYVNDGNVTIKIGDPVTVFHR